jgi:hypothetical protein
MRRAALCWVVICAAGLAACAPDDTDLLEAGPDERWPAEDCEGAAVSRDGLVTSGACAGCDPRCWLTKDQPSVGTDVDTTEPGKNAENVVYSPGVGVVLSGVVSGADTDADGIPDSEDPNPADPNGDQDADGVPDAYEYYLYKSPVTANPPPPANEIYAVLPSGGPPATYEIPPDVPVAIRSADIYFLIDTTSSMAGEITNLQTSLSTYVIPEVQARIADVQFGVGHYRDYMDPAVARPFYHVRNITSDTALVQTAINSLGTGTGQLVAGDLTESATEALHAVVSGLGIGCGTVNASCPVGTSGYPCFRDGSQPIIVLVTDHEFHRGVYDTLDPPLPASAPCYDYTGCVQTCIPIPLGIPDLDGVIAEMIASGVKLLGVWSGVPGGTGRVNTWPWGRIYPDYDDAIDIYYAVEQSGSVDSFGVPFLYGVSADGLGIDAEVVNGIDAIVSEMLLDVSSTWHDPDPLAPDTSVLISDVDPTACSACLLPLDHVNNVANDASPGSTVTFQITLQNELTDIPATPAAQTYDVHVEILGDGASVLADRIIHVLIPGTAPATVPVLDGIYWRDFDAMSGTTCTGAQTPRWSRLYYSSIEPAGTYIEFFVRTADLPTDLPTAARVNVPTVPTESTADIQAALTAASIPTSLDNLRVEAELHSDTPGHTPTLQSMTVELYCL